jgi:hypothetical protein
VRELRGMRGAKMVRGGRMFKELRVSQLKNGWWRQIDSRVLVLF